MQHHSLKAVQYDECPAAFSCGDMRVSPSRRAASAIAINARHVSMNKGTSGIFCLFVLTAGPVRKRDGITTQLGSISLDCSAAAQQGTHVLSHCCLHAARKLVKAGTLRQGNPSSPLLADRVARATRPVVAVAASTKPDCATASFSTHAKIAANFVRLGTVAAVSKRCSTLA